MFAIRLECVGVRRPTQSLFDPLQLRFIHRLADLVELQKCFEMFAACSL
jgi:hypothetical protein